MTSEVDIEPQFCLRWNNFQSNITSEFENLRNNEDFIDVTIACEGSKLGAHKVVLSACSPFFKDLFKKNSCQHPIILMQDVKISHMKNLLEFMYVGEVNVCQADLNGFLKTAHLLKIRGLTDSNSEQKSSKKLPSESINHNNNLLDESSSSEASTAKRLRHNSHSNPTNTSQTSATNQYCSSYLNRPGSVHDTPSNTPLYNENRSRIETDFSASFSHRNLLIPKSENYEYPTDEELSEIDASMELENETVGECNSDDVLQDYRGLTTPGNDLMPNQNIDFMDKLSSRLYKKRGYGNSPIDMSCTSSMEFFTRVITTMEQTKFDSQTNRGLIKLAEGIEVEEDQLRGVKWNDYRKLTRGLATILFSPMELATSSVTGQRWSRAGNLERPVKPALDRAKVQAIISYVATRFPTVEISNIKKVLAYKCKENSTAYKIKAGRL